METDCRVLVVQNGARHEYAVPGALHNRGMLEGFYTDVCGNQGIGKWIAVGAALERGGGKLTRLRSRVVPEQLLPQTRSFPIASWADDLARRRLGNAWQGSFVANAMIRAGTRGANMIYSSLGWASPFLTDARSKGIKVVTEFYVRPSHWRTHQEECLKYPEWEPEVPNIEYNNSPALQRGACAVSDYIIAPALEVQEDLVRSCEFPAERIRIVPYGVHPAFFETENRPKAGTVLFVGSCNLVKGIHLLAAAQRQVRQTDFGGQWRFIAAGGVNDRVRSRPECEGIEFLGRVPRHEVKQLYEEADVLVFPTLSDSFGMVMLEAMAAGIPVISSPYCADVVQDGVSGFVVDPHDTEALASAIIRLTSDRGLREKLATAARERAKEYSWLRHERELEEAMRAFHRL